MLDGHDEGNTLDVNKDPSPNTHVVLRRKKFATKARTGCLTCRIRRVKCDESKPSCRRCTTTGRKCDGYPSNSLNLSDLVQPSAWSSDSSQLERRALFAFRTRIAALMASSFDLDFWTYDILQAAEAHAPARHAVAALASAYQRSIISDVDSVISEQFILGHYKRALVLLRGCLENVAHHSRAQQVAILITNIILTCLCALQGYRKEACIHLRNGLALLHGWNFEVGLGAEDIPTAPNSERHLVAIFTRLDTQARVILDAVGWGTHYPWESHYLELPTQECMGCGSPGLALLQLETLHNQIIQYPDEKDLSLMHRTFSYRQLLSVWDFNVEAPDKSMLKEQNSSALALRLRRLMLDVNLAIRSNRNDLGDYFDTCGLEILVLTEQIISISGFKVNKMSFCLTNGITDALYFVAVRSKDWSTRQKAIDMLRKYPMIDGVWRSDAAADIAASYLQEDIKRYKKDLGL